MFKKQMHCITRYDTVTADENNCLKLSNSPLSGTLHYIHKLTREGYVGTGYVASDTNGFKISGNIVRDDNGAIQYGSTYFCSYNAMVCFSKVDLIRGEVEGVLCRCLPGNRENAKKRLKILQKHMISGTDKLRCDDVLLGKIPDTVDGARIMWSTNQGSMVEAYGEVVHGSFVLNHKVHLTMIGKHFIVLDVRNDGKPDFWEYSSDGGPYMPGPPCCSERFRHRLGDDRIEKYLNKLRAYNTAPTTLFCDWAEKLWRAELETRHWYEE